MTVSFTSIGVVNPAPISTTPLSESFKKFNMSPEQVAAGQNQQENSAVPPVASQSLAANGLDNTYASNQPQSSFLGSLFQILLLTGVGFGGYKLFSKYKEPIMNIFKKINIKTPKTPKTADAL
ncbi:MAG: hypothetical protein PHV68_07035, partial [Candidatus Gastranaerophilales bacterium]|nr:hypothetical protein [Candidatus Gastranaerophilales bacterium]